MAAGFTYEPDNASEWRWHLKDDNGAIVADSGEGYASRRDAEHGARVFTQLGPDAPEHETDGPSGKGKNPDWEYFQGDDDDWYWHFEAANGKVVADGAEGYASKANVKRAITNVKELLRRLQQGGGFEHPAPTGPGGGGRFA